jgi:hypothetical protein
MYFLPSDIYHATFDPASEVDVAMRLVPDINSSEPIMVERLEQYHRWVWWFKRRYEGTALRNEERLCWKRDYYEWFADVRNLVGVGVLTALNVEELSKRRCFKRDYRWFADRRIKSCVYKKATALTWRTWLRKRNCLKKDYLDDLPNDCIQFSRDIDGVLSCYKKIVRKINADQPKADVFAQGT